MNLKQRRWTRWLLPALKLILFALLCVFIYHALVSGNRSLDEHTWKVEPWWLVVSGLLYLLGTLPSAVYWQRVLVRTQQQVGLGESLRAYYISQLGKYVPGKWMVILLRHALLIRPVETTVVAASVFYETFTTLAAGSAVAAVVLLIWHSHQTLLIATALGSLLLLGVPTVPRVFQWLMHVLRIGRLNPTAGKKFGQMPVPSMLLGWLAISLGWLLQGASFWATLRALGATSEGPFHELSLHTAAVALGVVAGFLSQIPGGLAVREWVSAMLVEPEYGATVAIVSTIIFRLVLLVSELSISIILYASGWRRLRKPARSREELASAGSRESVA